jgi:hypothetical protein
MTIPKTHFCYRLSKPQGVNVAGGLSKLKKNPVTSLGSIPQPSSM